MITKNKRGQFYIIAVLIIISIAIGLITIENYVKKTKVDKVDDLSEEFKIEKNYVLDYVAHQDLTSGETDTILTNFSNNYVDKIGLNKDSVIITGTSTSARMIGNSGTGDPVQYNIGAGPETLPDGEFEQVFVSDDIAIIIDGNSYDFEMKEGQNIYYIIKHKYNEEIHITYG